MSTDSSMSTANKEKLGFRQKLGFGLGDIFGGGSGIVIGFYYLYFLTDVVRIDPALAGTVLLSAVSMTPSPIPWKESSPIGRERVWEGGGLT